REDGGERGPEDARLSGRVLERAQQHLLLEVLREIRVEDELAGELPHVGCVLEDQGGIVAGPKRRHGEEVPADPTSGPGIRRKPLWGYFLTRIGYGGGFSPPPRASGSARAPPSLSPSA